MKKKKLAFMLAATEDYIFAVGNIVLSIMKYMPDNPKYRDGEQLRDFVWVGDIAAVILWMLKNSHVNGIYNVGTGKARSFYDLAKATWKAVGKEPIRNT